MSEHPTRHPTIVVGYDGSRASLAAVERGIDRVGASGHLILVHTYLIPTDYMAAAYYEQMVTDAADGAERVLDELELTQPRLAAVSYERQVVRGPAAAEICAIAAHRKADEIILGSRGVGRLRGLLGSVAHDVLHEAKCPVVVIPQRMLEPLPAETVTARA
jgi:nucleotide-binding universal stress UspA family protein